MLQNSDLEHSLWNSHETSRWRCGVESWIYTNLNFRGEIRAGGIIWNEWFLKSWIITVVHTHTHRTGVQGLYSKVQPHYKVRKKLQIQQREGAARQGGRKAGVLETKPRRSFKEKGAINWVSMLLTGQTR